MVFDTYGSLTAAELGCPRNKTKKIWFEPKITETGSVSRLFRFIFKTNDNLVSVCFGVSMNLETIETNSYDSKLT